MEVAREIALREFRTIPSIGKACAYDLWKIGIRKISDLKNQNPALLYERLNLVTGMQHDICMLYTLRCAVYYASTTNRDPEKLNWWYWKGKKFKE